MSFLNLRRVASEGAYFKEASKSALVALKQNLEKRVEATIEGGADGVAHTEISSPEIQADVLPEVLRHSAPLLVCRAELEASAKKSSPVSTSLAAVSALNNPHTSADVARVNGMNTKFVAVPQAMLGPRKWELDSQTVNVVPSTANAARSDGEHSLPSKEAVEGLLLMSKAFLIATGIVFGGGTLAMGVTAARLQVTSPQDFETKGKEWMKPRIESMQRGFEPVRNWAQGLSAKVRLDESKRQEVGAGFAKVWHVTEDNATAQHKWKSIQPDLSRSQS